MLESIAFILPKEWRWEARNKRKQFGKICIKAYSGCVGGWL